MQTVIQATPGEFIEMVRQAVREELKNLSVEQNALQKSGFNKKEAAKYLNVSLSTLERLIKGRAFVIYRIGKRIFIKKEALDNYLKTL